MKSSGRASLSFNSGYEFRLLMGRHCSLPALLTRKILTLLVVSLAMSGCDKNQLTPFDSKNTAPIVSNLLVSPDSIYIDNLTPSNGEYAVSTNIGVAASDGDGPSDLAAVTADVIRPDGTLAASGVMLHDDGMAPDSVAGDRFYSGTAQFTLIRAQAGRYQIRVSASDRKGAMSNGLQSVLKLSRRNSPPTIGSVFVPDTVNLPTSEYILVQFTASAADSDGLNDIQQVYFYRIEPVDPTQTRFQMRDDGNLDPPVTVGNIAVTSGDDVAGDGRYSFLIPLRSTDTRRTNLFGFRAVDTFGDTSATIQKYFTVR